MTEEKKPVTKKKTAPKKKKAPVKKPEILSYAIKMVIPTVAYGNIQPEIVVKANSMEEAHDFIVPHMNKLWKEYYLVDGRRPEKPEPAPTPVVTTEPAPTPVPAPAPTQAPPSSVALVKATSAIDSCTSYDALLIIMNQVHISEKLSQDDKALLKPLIEAKEKELNGK